MASLDFPSNPSLGQEFTGSNGLNYQWDGNAWTVLTGNDSSDAFITNSNSVVASYTLPANKNAMSAGPVEIKDGAIVEIPSGQSWAIV